MFVKNLSQFFSTFLIVIISVHFVITLDKVTDKQTNGERINQNNTNTDKLAVEPSFRRTRLLTDFPSPVYVPSESKKSKKSTKYKKKKRYEKEDEDDDEQGDNEEDEEEEEEAEEEEEEEEEEGEKPYKKSKNYYSNSKSNKPIIKYVPIPVYLNPPTPKPKPKPSPMSPYGLTNSITIEDLMSMKNIGGYGMMGMDGGSYGSMPNLGTGYNKMGMNPGVFENYGLSNMINGYPPPMRNNGGSASYGKPQNQKYVVANYAKSGYGSKGARSYESYDGNSKEEMENPSNYGDNDDRNQYEDNQAYYDNNQNDNYSVNKPSKTKSYSNSMNIRRPKKRPQTTTTTEPPIDYETNTEEDQQNGDHNTKAKQIAKMLEMLDKWN